ncbi:MAG: EpsI family protein [Hydrogenophilales bacterium 28-61-23]|nr:MAG: EpsI family protein [Hydrogenophilales bacterium 28-61-23]
MKFINLRYLIIGFAMIAAAGLALALTPKEKLADQRPTIKLETMIPKAFGSWRLDESVRPIQVAPDVQAELDKIYDETLSRTYINEQGARIMLSMAYGGNQSDTLAVHKPEVCYPAQGFQVQAKTQGSVNTSFGSIRVTKLVAQQRERVEPITYWINVGGKQVTGRLERKLEQLKFGMTGKVPFGVLIRVSNINNDTQAGYATQAEFIEQLLAAVSPAQRTEVFGI